MKKYVLLIVTSFLQVSFPAKIVENLKLNN